MGVGETGQIIGETGVGETGVVEMGVIRTNSLCFEQKSYIFFIYEGCPRKS